MRILHFSIGLPPARSGGLTKYATDLMLEQQSRGHQVMILHPEFKIQEGGKWTIARKSSFRNIERYVFTNATPVTLLHGIKNPISLLKKASVDIINSFYDFIKVQKPDVFHIHSFMGLPIEFLQCLKDQNVKIVFSSHDYYGLCLKVNFINEKGILCKKPSGENCARCNQNSPNATFLRIRNAEIILHHKKMFSFLLHIKPRFSKPKAQIEHQKISQQKIIEFDKVINHYSQMFSLIDCFHFNSSVARDVYQAHLGDLQHKLIPITHAGILDNRQKRTIRSSNIQLGFIGNDTVYKGLPMLLSVLRTLAAEGKSNWTLHIWGNNKKGNTDEEKIIWHGKFKPSEYDKVFSEIDILIVPSLWNETFSLVTLEALSFAVPVMVSSNVGAKDIVINYEPTFVIEPTAEVLKAKLLYILSDYQSIINYHLKIRKGPFYYGLAQHAQDIEIELYHN